VALRGGTEETTDISPRTKNRASERSYMKRSLVKIWRPGDLLCVPNQNLGAPHPTAGYGLSFRSFTFGLCVIVAHCAYTPPTRLYVVSRHGVGFTTFGPGDNSDGTLNWWN